MEIIKFEVHKLEIVNNNNNFHNNNNIYLSICHYLKLSNLYTYFFQYHGIKN